MFTVGLGLFGAALVVLILQGERAALTTGAPVAGPDARASLLGTIKRANSKT